MPLSMEWTVTSFVFSRRITPTMQSSMTSPLHSSAAASAKFLLPCRQPVDEVHSTSAIACNSIGGQAFSSNVNAFQSQAECTLDRYSQGGYSSGDRYRSEGGHSKSSHGSCSKLEWGDSCFGCKRPHPYIKNKVILCPNKDKPGLRATAEKAYKEWLEKLCKRNKKCKDYPLD